MDERFIIQLQGKNFVTYEGLLDEAHRQGLESIRVDVVQLPSEENNMTAVWGGSQGRRQNLLGFRRCKSGFGRPKPCTPHIENGIHPGKGQGAAGYDQYRDYGD